MVKFEKVEDYKYRAMVSTDLLTKVENTLKEYSLDMEADYLEVNNEEIKKLLLARLISSYFFKDTSIEYNHLGFAIIYVSGLNFKFEISLGKIQQPGEEKFNLLSGVYYSV